MEDKRIQPDTPEVEENGNSELNMEEAPAAPGDMPAEQLFGMEPDPDGEDPEFSEEDRPEDYFFDDYTDKMKYYYSKWEKLGLEFDGIYTGFLGSERQVDIVSDFIRRFCSDDTKVIVDPVMGDDGRTYATLTPGLCKSLSRLIRHSDIITPNLTEACILTGTPYSEKLADVDALTALARRLSDSGSKNIVITGITRGNNICNFIYEQDGSIQMIEKPLSGSRRAGTGDVFASVIAADTVRGVPFAESVRRAADFVSKAIAASDELDIPEQDGLCFELFLGDLVP